MMTIITKPTTLKELLELLKDATNEKVEVDREDLLVVLEPFKKETVNFNVSADGLSFNEKFSREMALQAVYFAVKNAKSSRVILHLEKWNFVNSVVEENVQINDFAKKFISVCEGSISNKIFEIGYDKELPRGGSINGEAVSVFNVSKDEVLRDSKLMEIWGKHFNL